MIDRIRQLASIGCENAVPFGPMCWQYPDRVLPHYAVDLPHKVVRQSQAVLDAFDLWADAGSRMEYLAQVRWRMFFDFSGLSAPSRETIYFPPDLIRLQPDEVFVDCGAFDGDTLRQFLSVTKETYRSTVAFEPDPKNFAKLAESRAALPESLSGRVTVERRAVSGEVGLVHFSADGSPSSHVGEGDVVVDAVTLDTYLGNLQATFIKMDIEGAELDALRGARRQIQDSAPILAISCYHRQDHLWRIPLLIHSINSEYSFYLRPHDLDVWDLVCYAIPRARLRGAAA
jgi:FkbM family methyltransferase